MLIISEKYPELRLNGLVKFSGGKAEVSDQDVVESLRGFAHMGVVVPEAEQTIAPAETVEKVDGDEGKDAGDGDKLERPAGNAAVEAWQAYAIQEGHDVTDLKRDDIKALFTE